MGGKGAMGWSVRVAVKGWPSGMRVVVMWGRARVGMGSVIWGKGGYHVGEEERGAGVLIQ